MQNVLPRIIEVLFQSTPPGWEATNGYGRGFVCDVFQSTPPGWEATTLHIFNAPARIISIHASRMGGDRENGHTVPRYGKNIHSRH